MLKIDFFTSDPAITRYKIVDTHKSSNALIYQPLAAGWNLQLMKQPMETRMQYATSLLIVQINNKRGLNLLYKTGRRLVIDQQQ